MKIRAGHLLIVFLLLVLGLIVWSMTTAPPRAPEDGGMVRSGSLVPGLDEDREGNPEIELAIEELDLGLVPNDELTTTEVQFFNRGDKTLEILDIQTTCPCTLGLLPKDQQRIPPGGEGYFSVAFNPYRVSGFDSLKTLTIISNDYDNPRVRLQVKADIVPEFEIVPEAPLDFGAVQKAGLPVEKSAIIRQLGEETLEVKSATLIEQQGSEASTGMYALAVEQLPEADWVEPGKREYRLAVTLKPSTPVGEFYRAINIELNLERLPTYNYSLRGEVVSFYQISPPYPQPVMILQGAEGAELPAVEVSAKEPFIITEAEATAPFEVAVEMGPDQLSARLVPTLSDAAPPGRHSGEMIFTIATDEHEFQERAALQGLGALAPPPAAP